MRLRALSETECYTRCYGSLRSDRVSVIKLPPGERREVLLQRRRRLARAQRAA